ncbi:hypothetical protein PICSAR179_04562 [Mycobacterium avium subsp. paratuberculosis]|nr:hypothetical protein PICSAR179_04562 [Mycobacterium avium subsp. paratuberculosis]
MVARRRRRQLDPRGGDADALVVPGVRAVTVRGQRHQHHAADHRGDAGQRAAGQQHRPRPARGRLLLVGDGAVGAHAGARTGVAPHIQIGGVERGWIHLPGARVQRVGQRRRRRREQRRVRRGQGRAAGQRHVRLLGAGDRNGAGRLQRRFHRDDVGSAADHEHAVGAGVARIQAGDHRRQLGRHRRAGAVRDLVAVQIDDRTVAHVDDRQRRAARLDEQHPDVPVAERIPDRLRQRGRGQQRRDQHHVAQLVGGDRIPQRRGPGGVGPGNPRRGQPVAALENSLAGADDRVDHLVGRRIRRILSGSDRELFLFDGHAVGILSFDRYQADRPGSHRHPKHDVHVTPPRSCTAPRDPDRAGRGHGG